VLTDPSVFPACRLPSTLDISGHRFPYMRGEVGVGFSRASSFHLPSQLAGQRLSRSRAPLPRLELYRNRAI
jgi:hypothetical protein